MTAWLRPWSTASVAECWRNDDDGTQIGVLHQRLDIDAADDLVDVDPGQELILSTPATTPSRSIWATTSFDHPVDYLLRSTRASTASGRSGRSARSVAALDQESITRCATPCAIDSTWSATRLVAERLTLSPGYTSPAWRTPSYLPPPRRVTRRGQ